MVNKQLAFDPRSWDPAPKAPGISRVTRCVLVLVAGAPTQLQERAGHQDDASLLPTSRRGEGLEVEFNHQRPVMSSVLPTPWNLHKRPSTRGAGSCGSGGAGRAVHAEMETCAPSHTWPRAALPSALPEPRPVLQTRFCELLQQITGPEEKWVP